MGLFSDTVPTVAAGASVTFTWTVAAGQEGEVQAPLIWADDGTSNQEKKCSLTAFKIGNAEQITYASGASGGGSVAMTSMFATTTVDRPKPSRPVAAGETIVLTVKNNSGGNMTIAVTIYTTPARPHR